MTQAAGPAAAASTAAGTLLNETYPSARLGREVGYRAFLPAGVGPGAQAPARVLYLLHGSGGDSSSWLRGDRLAPALAGALAVMPGGPMAVVMPSFGPASWWVDGATEAVASAFVDELMPRAEARLGLAPAPAGGRRRALAGVSMGGYGAFGLALGWPQRFCAAALIAPALYDGLPPPASAAWRAAPFTREGAFDAAQWHARHPMARFGAYAAQPQRVAFWIASGDHDELGIAGVSARLFERLHALQPGETELRIVDGGHDGPTFDALLPEALGYLGRRCAAAPGA